MGYGRECGLDTDVVLLCFLVPPRYSNWSQWSGCDADCGGGVRERMRQCIHHGSRGGSCSSLGPSRMTQLCNLSPCEGKSLFGAWSIWAKKSVKQSLFRHQLNVTRTRM